MLMHTCHEHVKTKLIVCYCKHRDEASHMQSMNKKVYNHTRPVAVDDGDLIAYIGIDVSPRRAYLFDFSSKLMWGTFSPAP